MGANAIALGEPIGDETEFPELLSTFLEYCDLNGWACAFHQVRPQYLALFEALGLKSLKIGEEAIVPTAEFSLEGHEMKRLRSTIARFEREGYRTEVLSPPHDRGLLQSPAARYPTSGWRSASGGNGRSRSATSTRRCSRSAT